MSLCERPDKRLVPFLTPAGGTSYYAEETVALLESCEGSIDHCHHFLAQGRLDAATTHVAHALDLGAACIQASLWCVAYANCVEHEADMGRLDRSELAEVARLRLRASTAATEARALLLELRNLAEQVVTAASQADYVQVCDA